MSEKTTSKLVGSSTIAQLFGVSIQWVQTLTRNSVIHAVSRQGGYKYDLLPTIQRYIKHLTEKAEGKAAKVNKWEEVKLEAEADLKRSKADMAAHEYRQLESNLIPSEVVAAGFDDLMGTIRREVETLPDVIAPKLTGIHSTAEASVVIQTEVYAVLNRLAEYRYEPDRKKANE